MNEKDEMKTDYDYGDAEVDSRSPSAEESFLDDDESFLAGDDSVIMEKDALSLFKQSENVISYEFLNLYNENGKPRSRMAMRNDPPILHISSSDDQSVDFILTQNLVKHLSYMLKEVDKSYSGIPSSKKKQLDQEEITGWFNKAKKWIYDNKVKSGILGALGLLFLVYTIVLSF